MGVVDSVPGDGSAVVGGVIGREEAVPTEAHTDIINTYKVPGVVAGGCGGRRTCGVGLKRVGVGGGAGG